MTELLPRTVLMSSTSPIFRFIGSTLQLQSSESSCIESQKFDSSTSMVRLSRKKEESEWIQLWLHQVLAWDIVDKPALLEAIPGENEKFSRPIYSDICIFLSLLTRCKCSVYYVDLHVDVNDI
ncbi:hypothetical protein MPTK1_2g00650 [Marchantia polymorpha subsp. ruderalis]|uniref:Uncharacterized protein n=1 Tax=Marchantia polymorpha TaxID=3197 RepID=A0A2R6X9J2_MARPO|nr:hypothetical protein MARPO_0028s0086 [Marchantia polymorpha]BBN00624.1 hypothetical protein Mp_2g00650 [Marchantia polymorpha subsp. ruderalis]|eukprot:PTQ42773.1 hypothetical protein MARPO_0028s0086 [Marchantia polymorpha]